MFEDGNDYYYDIIQRGPGQSPLYIKIKDNSVVENEPDLSKLKNIAIHYIRPDLTSRVWVIHMDKNKFYDAMVLIDTKTNTYWIGDDENKPEPLDEDFMVYFMERDGHKVCVQDIRTNAMK